MSTMDYVEDTINNKINQYRIQATKDNADVLDKAFFNCGIAVLEDLKKDLEM